MPASPYFSRLYFDPTYFDDDALAGGRPPKALPVPEPLDLDEELLEWII